MADTQSPAATPTSKDAKVDVPTPVVRLTCIEICRFRRLKLVSVSVDAQTTILVGANNSGKTSILAAIRQFLADRPAFGAFDLSVDEWPALRGLAKEWEALDEDPATTGSKSTDWERDLQTLLASMPTLDLWFDAKPGAFHIVAPFMPSLTWSGGPIGVRLRLEPASDIASLQKLAWRYREARKEVRDHSVGARAWPTDLLDYWQRHRTDLGRVVAYKLDPSLGPLTANPADEPQKLAANAVQIECKKLAPLVKVDFVAAQRGLGGEEADSSSGSDSHRVGLFSNQMIRYAQRHLNSTGTSPSCHPELVEAIAKAQGELDTQIQAALEPTIKDVAILGYPGLHDPKGIHFRTRIPTEKLLDHGTAVQYGFEDFSDVFLPEHAIGLGYQNLQSLSYQLVHFREARLNPGEGSPSAVHLVLVEEPEAHLHVQVQRVFPKEALKLITPKSEDHASLASQLILSTHASHLAHAESFTRLRYVRRVVPKAPGQMPSSEVSNLADAFGNDQATRTFAERYFQVQHTDLLFADGAVFVEGIAERMLVPFFIERDFPDLRSRYLSFLELGGSHAHRLRPLVERLGIPTVVITDIDPVRPTTGADSKVTKKAAAITDPKTLECGNATLTQWHPCVKALNGFSVASNLDPVWTNGSGTRVRFAWQMPIPSQGSWPSSFEDAFVLTNLDWFKNRTDEIGAVGKVVRAVNESQAPDELNETLHGILRDKFDKGSFAATIFERLCMGEKLRCPDYISDALRWLQGELEPTRVGARP